MTCLLKQAVLLLGEIGWGSLFGLKGLNNIGCGKVCRQTEGVENELQGNHDNTVSDNHQALPLCEPWWRISQLLPFQREGRAGSKHDLNNCIQRLHE